MARTRNIRSRALIRIFNNNYINEFNLISCYLKQEIGLHSLTFKKFCILMNAVNNILLHSNSHSHHVEYNKMLFLAHSINKQILKIMNNTKQNNLYISNFNKFIKLNSIEDENIRKLRKLMNEKAYIDKPFIFSTMIRKVFQMKRLNLFMFFVRNNIFTIDDINMRDRNGNSSLNYGFEGNNKIEKIVHYLLNRGGDFQNINDKIINLLREDFDPGILKVLIENNFNINQVNHIGTLLLNRFIQDRNENSNKIAKSLIDYGVQVNIDYRHEPVNEEPLVCAIRTRNIEMLKYLLSHNANVNYINYYNYINEYYNYNVFCSEYYYEIYLILNNYRSMDN